MLRPAGSEGITVVRLLLPHPHSLEISSDWIHLFIYFVGTVKAEIHILWQIQKLFPTTSKKKKNKHKEVPLL